MSDIRALLHELADALADKLVGEEAPAAAPSANMRIKDFADHEGLGESTVRKYIGEGMPVNRLGPKRLTIPVAEAEAWLLARGKGRAA